MSYEKASSRSLRNHYSSDLNSRDLHPGRQGSAICNGNITVYDDIALRSYSFTNSALEKDRKMCKLCAKKVAGV